MIMIEQKNVSLGGSQDGKRRSDDTYNRMPWREFITFVESYAGFKCGFCKKFISYNLSGEDPIEEEEVVYYIKDKGIILHACSYRGNVNSARVYGELVIRGEQSEEQKKAYKKAAPYISEPIIDGFRGFGLNVGFGGLRRSLDYLLGAFEFSKTWQKKHAISFFNYIDGKVIFEPSGRDAVHKIEEENIANCAEEVRTILNRNNF